MAFARALAMEPSVLLCREITSALYPGLVGEGLRVAESLADDGVTMHMVNHEMNFARKASDRVILMHTGQVPEMRQLTELFGKPKTDEVQQFLSSITV